MFRSTRPLVGLDVNATRIRAVAGPAAGASETSCGVRVTSPCRSYPTRTWTSRSGRRRVWILLVGKGVLAGADRKFPALLILQHHGVAACPARREIHGAILGSLLPHP